MKKVLVLTYNANDHKSDDEEVLNRLIAEFRYFRAAGTAWHCWQREGVEPGVEVVIMQQGRFGHGVFARGVVVGPTFEGRSLNKQHKTGITKLVPIYLTEVVDPRREFILDADECRALGFNLSQRNSGQLYDVSEKSHYASAVA